MKVLFTFAVFSIVTVLGFTLPMSQGQEKLDIAALEKVILRKYGKASNALGELIASSIHKIVANLTDPATVLNGTGIEIPIVLKDPVDISGIINVTNVELAGQSQINVTNAFATLIPLGADLTFYIPEIVLTGQYRMKLETPLFPVPISGDGPFTVKISGTTLTIKLRLGSTLAGQLKLNSFSYDVDVYDIGGSIEGLFPDIDPSGKLNAAVNILFNSYASTQFNMFESKQHDNLTQLATDIGNDILGNLTLEDIIGIIGGGSGKIPVELFELSRQ